MLAIYTRVSTEEQAKGGISLSNQLSKGIELSKRLGMDYVHYEDAGLSGTLPIEQRPSMKKLTEDIVVKKKVTHLYIFDLSRLSREPLHYHTLLKIFNDNKITVYDSNGLIDFTNVDVMMMNAVKNIFDSILPLRTRANVRSNLEKSAKMGRWGGGKMLPYGYKREDKMLVIDETEAKVIKEAFNLSLKNNGIRVICNIFNENNYPTRVGGKWRDGTMYSVLTNPIYYGKRRYKEQMIDAPSIISKELFDMVQTNLKSNMKFKADKKHFYLLKGLIKCGQCGKSFYGRKRADLRDKAYVCLSGRYTKEFCGCRGIDIDYLDSVVINSVNALPTHIKKFYNWFEKNDMIKMVKLDLSTYRKKEKELEEKKEKFIDLALDGAMNKADFNKRIKSFDEQIAQCQMKKNELLPQLGVLDRKNDIQKIVDDFIFYMDDESQRQAVLRALVDKVTVLWIPEKKYHLIEIGYKIDSLSEYKLSEDLQVEYKQSGFRLNRSVSNSNLTINQIGSEVFVKIA